MEMTTAIHQKTIPKPKNQGNRWKFQQNIPLYWMLLPTIIAAFLFNIYPLYGIIIAFQDYDLTLGFWKSPWIGLENFNRLFSLPDFYQVLRNTIVISSGKILLGQFFALLFALLLNEIRFSPYKRLVQSLTYLPYFLSWIVFGGMMRDILDTQGIVNNGLHAIGFHGIEFLGNATIFPITVIATDILKNFGWGAIIYLAALTNVDPALHEAAAVDGANRFQRIIHVTLPGISSTIIVVLTISLGYVLNAGLEQILVLYNTQVYNTGDILDTFVYRAGLLRFQYSLAAAVGLFKSIVGLAMISTAYYVAHKLADYRIF